MDAAFFVPGYSTGGDLSQSEGASLGPYAGAPLQFVPFVDKNNDNRQGGMTRSEQRIPRLRTRGRENRRRLLAEAERLLLEGGGRRLRFSDVFAAAGVSRGSAYRIYNGIDDLMQDLATEWVNNFVEFLNLAEPETAPESWPDVSDFVVQRAADYWARTADTIRVLPRVRSHEPSSYRAALSTLSEVIALILDRYFVVPEIPDWLAKMAFYARICDITFSDAVRSEGRISEQRTLEAQALCRTYLTFYLPPRLPMRDPAEA